MSLAKFSKLLGTAYKYLILNVDKNAVQYLPFVGIEEKFAESTN